MQDADAARRLAILRGETPPPLPEPELPDDPADKKHTRRERGHDGVSLGGVRKRKRAGEDDTEFEMRVARERVEVGARVAGELGGAGGPKRQKGQDVREEVSIVDSRGHIDLVGPRPEDAGRGDDRKDTDRERGERRKREAGGKDEKNYLTGGLAGQPWYEGAQRRQTVMKDCWLTAGTAEGEHRKAERGMEAPTQNVWGRDDPKRKDREMTRLDANDPLAVMKSGAKKVRDIAKERRQGAEERGRELEQLRQEERRREKRRKRERARPDDGENEDGPQPESHRSRRSERRHHEDERRGARHDHVRDERRRHRESGRDRDRETDRDHGRESERSRERGSSSRSHRDKHREDRRHHRGNTHESRHSGARRSE